MRMKALKTFRGREGLVRRGREFTAPDESRAKELKDARLAAPIAGAAGKTKEAPAQAGAKAGAAAPAAPAAPQGRQPRAPRSAKASAAPATQPSANEGGLFTPAQSTTPPKTEG